MRKKLINISATCVSKEKIMKRVIYDFWENKYARIRDEWDKITCTYKEISECTNDINCVKEVETTVWDFEAMKMIFEKMWIKQKAYQETKREIWEANWEIEFMIDTWPWLKPFIEIEGKNEEVVRKYTKLLWFNYEDWLFWAVDEVALKEIWMEKEVLNKISEITFEKPLKK
jgi:adenylate cyclase class 2